MKPTARTNTITNTTTGKLLKSLAWLAVCATVITAQAHTGLKESVPEDGATVSDAPEHIGMVFNGPVRLVRLELKTADRLIPTGFQVQAEPRARYRIATPGMEPGDFTVSWAAIGADGHTVSGSYRFTVSPGTGGE